jgi:hypothetical protein
VAVEVFEDDAGDPKTLAARIAKLKEGFGLRRVRLVSAAAMDNARDRFGGKRPMRTA